MFKNKSSKNRAEFLRSSKLRLENLEERQLLTAVGAFDVPYGPDPAPVVCTAAPEIDESPTVDLTSGAENAESELVLATTEMTWTVNSASDVGGDENIRTLRYCINNAQSGDTITFDLSKGATIELTKALPTINKSLTIDASSLYENETPGITFDGGNANRIFNVKSDKTVELIKLTLQNGKAGTDESPKNGGAIYNEGNLTLPGVVAKSNSATKNGGAVFNNFGASLTVKGGSIKSNVATKNGGAVANYGTLTIAVEETTISENTASRFGAPISVAERWKLQEARSLSKTKLLRTVPRAARFTTTSTGKT